MSFHIALIGIFEKGRVTFWLFDPVCYAEPAIKMPLDNFKMVSTWNFERPGLIKMNNYSSYCFPLALYIWVYFKFKAKLQNISNPLPPPLTDSCNGGKKTIQMPILVFWITGLAITGLPQSCDNSSYLYHLFSRVLLQVLHHCLHDVDITYWWSQYFQRPVPFS